MAAKSYSLARDGGLLLAPHFLAREFSCKDGTDLFKVDPALPTLLEKIRLELGPVSINSAYRTPAWNKKQGGVSNSQHVKGTAADIVVTGASPLLVAQYAESLMPGSGGIGLYPTFTHVDVRTIRSRWKQENGELVSVTGFPSDKKGDDDEVTQEQFNTMMNAYLEQLGEQEPSQWSEEARGWAEDNGIIAGDENGKKKYKQPCTREQMVQFLYRVKNL